jgi:aryl-alcohol dehydrogenase-like predicted oxidoreductase
VTEVCLGTWGLSGGGYGHVADEVADAVIDRAVELGVDLFDTADVYGRGAMERRLGARLPATARIVTKIGTDLDGTPPRKRFDLDYLRPAFERARERIGRDTLDVVLLHNPSVDAMRTSEPVDFLKELKRLGALRAWGVSAGDSGVARMAAERDADVVELAYNFFSTGDLHEVSGALMGHGTAVLARSILAHGLLAGLWPTDHSFPEGDHRKERWTAEDLRRRLAQLDALRPAVTGAVSSMRAAAIRFVLANQMVTSAVVGPRMVSQLEELVSDVAEGPPYLKDTVLAELAARVRGVGVSK